ncbi:hypothetical protein HDU85_002568 [Gaertneriomyces sp. JEL0708]|nr:hypothetical protein HDU85_002568 [Gaertneriomyces sp. JEL0708]
MLRRAVSTPPYKYLRLETHANVALVILNRPKAFNALSVPLIAELNAALHTIDTAHDRIRAIVLTGSSERAFAAGADIQEMAGLNFVNNIKHNFVGDWSNIARIRKPLIAAVNGIAFGGGCELAMMCDIIYAGDKASFAQPEIKLGIIPGAGGTQRLVHAIGKSKAMHLCLTGEALSAIDAERAGLVARIFPRESLVQEAIKKAQSIAEMSLPSTLMCKEAIQKSFDLPLKEGLHLERRLFQSTFATRDQKEGMQAFLDKRDPKWSHD